MPTLDRNLAIILFQCARELVYNMAKHAQASAGRIELDIQDQTLQLVVSDNGRGFPPTATVEQPGAQGGYGLFSVRERLALLGGSLSMASGAAGARVSIRAPLTSSGDNPPLPAGEQQGVRAFLPGEDLGVRAS
jgi:signal transduction histidine kinase